MSIVEVIILSSLIYELCSRTNLKESYKTRFRGKMNKLLILIHTIRPML